MRKPIIAVDFDGTLCENKYPEIGKPYHSIIDNLLFQRASRGARLILWTCRTGDRLLDAVRWCEQQGLDFDAVNENLPEIIEMYGEDSRKITADEYWDDKSIMAKESVACNGATCGWVQDSASENIGESEARPKSYMSQSELLTQLAEEACELGQAALKVRRTLSNENPTPVSHEEAVDNLNEEFGDVLTVYWQLDGVNDFKIFNIAKAKQARWLERLKLQRNQKAILR